MPKLVKRHRWAYHHFLSYTAAYTSSIQASLSQHTFPMWGIWKVESVEGEGTTFIIKLHT